MQSRILAIGFAGARSAIADNQGLINWNYGAIDGSFLLRVRHKCLGFPQATRTCPIRVAKPQTRLLPHRLAWQDWQRECVAWRCAMRSESFKAFPPGKGGGEEVAYGRKGKGILIHTLTEGGGMPLANSTTAANKSEREQIFPLLNSVKLKTLKPGR